MCITQGGPYKTWNLLGTQKSQLANDNDNDTWFRVKAL